MTCPLCGEREHGGPCYKEWREKWIKEDARRFSENLVAELFKVRPSKADFISDMPDEFYNAELTIYETEAEARKASESLTPTTKDL